VTAGFEYWRGVEVTVIVRDLDGKPGTYSCTQHVSHEFAVNAQLETPVVEDAAVRAVREIAGQVLDDARREKRERERLARMVGGLPVTAERMAAHLSQLLDEAGDAEYRMLAGRGRTKAMWTPGADPYAEGAGAHAETGASVAAVADVRQALGLPPTPGALWIEEPDYAASYGRGVAAGIAGAEHGAVGVGGETSPAFHRGFAAGYRATHKAARRRSVWR